MLARVRLLVVAAAALAVLALAGCGSGASAGTAAAVSTTVVTTPTSDNDFIPTDQNLTDCVGTLEKPDCGSNRKDDLNMYLTFGVLMGGMALIGWRIAVAVRQRDRAQEEHVPEHTY